MTQGQLVRGGGGGGGILFTSAHVWILVFPFAINTTNTYLKPPPPPATVVA